MGLPAVPYQKLSGSWKWVFATTISLVPRPPPFLPSVCIHNNSYTGIQFFTGLTLLCSYCCECKQKVKTGEAWKQGELYITLDFDCGIMNFVPTGAGIYVRYRYLSYSSTSLPNNSIISSYTGYSRWSSYRRIEFYCCSNSTSGYTSTFIGLNGNSYSGRIGVEHFSSSQSYAGCMYIYLDSSSAQDTSEQGVYTCRMPDSAGRNIDVNVGIFRDDYTSEFLLLCASGLPYKDLPIG